jgi:transcriptional regulator with XRE-family HTH domain
VTVYHEVRQRFAQRLRSMRNERGLTQEKLAELIGKTVEHVSFLERAERSPSFEILFDLAEALGISASSLLEDSNGAETLGIVPVTEPLPEPIQGTPPAKVQQQTDLDRLHAAFEGIREAQKLADEYGINDILQDNGGKVLQVLIILGLRMLPGREGNDAVDAEGNEYELKTVNVSLGKSRGITTHHHLNKDIIEKYRAVKAWYIAIYEGVELKQIYRVEPANLDPLFTKWERQVEVKGSLNNPKIPMRFVKQGECVYQSVEGNKG